MQTRLVTQNPEYPLPHSKQLESHPAARVLLLTSGLGYGHLRAAQALEAALLQRSCTVQILDLWSLMNPGVASTIHHTYLRLVQEYPALYERLYHLDEHTWRQILESEYGPPAEVLEVLELISDIAANTATQLIGSQYASDKLLLSLLCTTLPYDGVSLAGTGARARLAVMKWTWMRLSKRLETLVAQFAPDVIVSTQMIPAAMIAALKRRGRLHVPHIGVLTDYGMHDFWRQSGTDRYCIAHESIVAPGDSVITGANRLMSAGVPLMPSFAQLLSQAEARRQLRLDAHRQTVLVLGGGLGLSVDAIAAQLLQRPGETYFLVMPGKNAQAHSQLSLLAAKNPQRMRVCGWTERMDIFIRAADVVVGKPGGISVAETLACGRPLFATRSLGGQEGFNVRFLENHEVGALIDEGELAQKIDDLLLAPQILARVQRRAWELGRRDGASRIANLALDMAWVHRPRIATQRH